ncbi:MAG TPA: hypothetical protein DDW94_07610 [Deltaproteobacteria bacterium]|nr:MAG: hypothetical protein A2Z79_02140 [Deltaproteobacteria bacterium GWA2_55_82]OGQ62627.1 MAG: hypothetical protein A3I81_08955 [Deltaproteobacteria bacterium RIFCSPLOWO2_02_FULL_55_12]OIJ74217.1 MAG: hypothetical protein A2V21_308040 [Deltaproteobacteria bacterium GWC2_55_46]HBG46840.1 hypothetical protein [Deltaproteobacteria bacterium]HCY11102.1 hypothetical protein [Deltaproteobacteria bacterium]
MIVSYWQIMAASMLLFSAAFAVENYFSIVPKYAVTIPGFILLFILAAEAGQVELKKLPKASRWLGIRIPMAILFFGSVIGLYKLGDTYPVYFFGDFYVIAQFIVVGMVFSLKRIERQTDRIFWGYFLSIAVISVAKFYFSFTKYYAEVGRFIPFDNLLVITSAWFAFYRLKVSALAVLSIFLVLSAMSGMRLGFFLSLLMTMVVIFIARENVLSLNRVTLAAALLLLLAVVNLSAASSFKTVERLFGAYEMNEEEMISTTSRFSEASAAVTEQMNNPIFNVLFGNGHGALYREYVFWDLEVNMTPKGTHNIHISPALFFFRYGLLGLAWYLMIFFYAISKAKRMLFLRSGGYVNDCRVISSLYLCSMLLSSFLGQNNFIYMDIPIMLYLTGIYEEAYA